MNFYVFALFLAFISWAVFQLIETSKGPKPNAERIQNRLKTETNKKKKLKIKIIETEWNHILISISRKSIGLDNVMIFFFFSKSKSIQTKIYLPLPRGTLLRLYFKKKIVRKLKYS